MYNHVEYVSIIALKRQAQTYKCINVCVCVLSECVRVCVFKTRSDCRSVNASRHHSIPRHRSQAMPVAELLTQIMLGEVQLEAAKQLVLLQRIM